jgi:hypothetical protein
MGPIVVDSLTHSVVHSRLTLSSRRLSSVSVFPYATPLLAAIVLGLSAVDGLATLSLIAAGLNEANPVMRFLLAMGPGPFLLGKLVLTVAGLGVMLSVQRKMLFGGRLHSGHLLLCLAAVYAVVIIYEIGLSFTLAV